MEAPTERQGFIDSCLLILHDWSSFVTLADEEIDKERGVITEGGARDNAQMRMLTNALPKMYPNNRYGVRMPIGLMSVVNGFKYNEQLRDYYHKWYRPDLQAIIVVGDVDSQTMHGEEDQEMFAASRTVNAAGERVYFPVETMMSLSVAIEKDKRRLPALRLWLCSRQTLCLSRLTHTIAGVMKNYLYGVTNRIIDERFTDPTMHKPNPAFISANEYISNYFLAQTKDALIQRYGT